MGSGRASGRAGFFTGTVLLVSSAHFFFDWYMNFPSPLMPLLASRLGLSLAQCGTAVAVASLTSSFSQPLFGWVTDRGLRPWALGPCVLWAAVFMVPLCWAPSYAWVVALATLGGLGGGLGHPLGSVATAAASGGRKGLGMAIYSTGGSLGYALTPLAVVPAVLALPPRWGWPLLLVPGLVGTALALSGRVRRLRLEVVREGVGWASAAAPGVEGSGAMPDAAGGEPPRTAGRRRLKIPGLSWPRQLSLSGLRTLILLNVVVGLRAWVHYALVVFIPLYFTGRGLDPVETSWLLSAFLAVGCGGGLLGGAVSDRWGRRNALVFTTLAAGLMVLPPWFVGPGAAVGLLLAGSFMLQAAFPATVVYAQELTPQNAGLASGLMTGLTWGLGGLGTALTGVVADMVGLEWALTATALLLLVAGLLAGVLPPEARQGASAGIAVAPQN
ncbi:MAG: MFS transporter [Acetobacteraceae bacterium]|nr:MFS transporter [Acetobacteraceae bacterium]